MTHVRCQTEAVPQSIYHLYEELPTFAVDATRHLKSANIVAFEYCTRITSKTCLEPFRDASRCVQMKTLWSAEEGHSKNSSEAKRQVRAQKSAWERRANIWLELRLLDYLEIFKLGKESKYTSDMYSAMCMYLRSCMPGSDPCNC